MKMFSRIGLALVIAAIALSGLQAATVDFWFAAKGDATGTPITSIDVSPGASFDVSVWYRTDDIWAHNALELLVGYDRAASVGTGASPLDGQIVPSGGVSGIALPVVLANNVGGGYSSTAGDRPYGAHLALGAALGQTVTAASGARICDISLKNQAIPEGISYDVTIWDAGSGAYWTSFAVMFRDIRRDGSAATLTVNSGGGAYQPISIDGAKSALDGTRVELTSEVVSAKLYGDSGRTGFAVEEADRSSGMRIVSTQAVEPGNNVTVRGVVATVSGERVIDASSGSVVVNSAGSGIDPLGMSNIRSGGGTYGAQGAVVDVAPDRMSSGLNSVGILATIWGKVTARSSTGSYGGYFYVDDGSNLQDGSGNIGIKCRPPGTSSTPGSLPAVDSYVAVTGIIGVQQIGGINARYLWTTSVQVLQSP